MYVYKQIGANNSIEHHMKMMSIILHEFMFLTCFYINRIVIISSKMNCSFHEVLLIKYSTNNRGQYCTIHK